MKKSRFTEAQIVSILNEADAGIKVQDICRKHGICPATFHRWKSKYGGMDASDLKKMKELEAENAELKRMSFGEKIIAATDFTSKRFSVGKSKSPKILGCVIKFKALNHT